MAKHITSCEVARLAKTSTATVSAVINGNKYVSPQLKEQVESAIKTLGYKPNLLARSLKIQETKSIGLIFTNITSPFWPPMVRTIQQITHQYGYDTILITTDDDVEREKVSLSNLISKRVDGIILTSSISDNYEHIQAAAKITPIIAVEREIPGLDSVIANNEEIFYQAVCHLLNHGYRRIGLITLPDRGVSTAHRIVGYKRALKERSLYDEKLIQKVDFAGEKTTEVTTRILVSTDVDAILTTSESTTLGVFRSVRESGRSIPDDLAIFGFDDVPWMEITNPPLSTIHQPVKEIAKTAIDLLLDRISGKKMIGKTHVVKSSLIFRESCGCRNRT